MGDANKGRDVRKVWSIAVIIKEDAKKLSFLFQEGDAYFELGYMILEQEHFDEMLPYKRGIYRGRERMTCLHQQYKPLREVLCTCSENDVIDIIYTLFSMTRRIEVSGLLKKECIWCQYEQMYYEESTGILKLALLPVGHGGLEQDGLNWRDRFDRTIQKIASFLSEKKQQRVMQLAWELLEEKKSCKQILQEVNCLGSGMSGLLVKQNEEEQDRQLELYYSDKERICQLVMDKEQYRIGKSQDEADGVIAVSQAVSRLHCMVIKQNQKFFVQDLNSVNHTFVNQEYIPPYEFMELENDDIISVADVDLRVHIYTKE